MDSILRKRNIELQKNTIIQYIRHIFTNIYGYARNEN